VEEWVKTIWEGAQALGLTSRWEFWVAVVAALVLYVLARRLGPPGWLFVKAKAVELHNIKPEPDPLDHTPSPAIPTVGGTPTSSGSIPMPPPPPPDFTAP